MKEENTNLLDINIGTNWELKLMSTMISVW